MNRVLLTRPLKLLAIGAALAALGYLLALEPALLLGVGAVAVAWGWLLWETSGAHPILSLLCALLPVYYLGAYLGGGAVTGETGNLVVLAFVGIVVGGYLGRGAFRYVRALLGLPYTVY